MLDSMAKLFVANSQYKVIAIALNITGTSTNLYITSNHGICSNIVKHINKL